MTRQWIRYAKLTVDGGGESIDLSNLCIRFQIQQRMMQTPTNASIMVSNLADTTAQKIQKEGQEVKLESGYEDGYGLLFKGNIIQKRLGRENPTDTYLGLVATTSDVAYNFGHINKSLASGHTLKDKVNLAYQAMKPYGVTLGYVSDLGSTKSPRAMAFYGMARDLLREVCFTANASWSIHNGELRVVKNTETLPGDAIVLNSMTGLVGMPIQTINGVEGRCLLNPQIGPNTKVKIDQASIQQTAFSPDYTARMWDQVYPTFVAADGLYKIVYATHQGDTRGTPWYTDFVAIRLNGGVIPTTFPQWMVSG